MAEDARISPEAIGSVLVCDLKENGIDDTGEMLSAADTHDKVFQRGYKGRSMAGIGLQRELRKENPCNVMTALAVEKREAGAVICLRIWNQEDNGICGTVSVKTKGKECSRTQAVEFNLGPLERKEYFLELADTQEEIMLEASSPIPGVRPSIYRVTDIQ